MSVQTLTCPAFLGRFIWSTGGVLNPIFRGKSGACTKSASARSPSAMAMEMHVFFRGKLPGKAALGRTMKELGFPVSVKAATGPLEGHSGYLPMRLRREETGVEFDIFQGRSMIDEFGLENV